MNNRRRQMFRVATRHYVDGETMEAIARSMDVSRSTVSRILAEARAAGIVEIAVRIPPGLTHRAEEVIGSKFGVKTTVVPVPPGSSPITVLDFVARAAGAIVSEAITADTRLGIAWGTTISAVVQRLIPHSAPGSRIVQLNGAANPTSSGVPYVGAIMAQLSSAFGSSVVDFPVPTFFDHPQTRELMWSERSVKRVLEEQDQLDVAIFGVGSLTGPLASHVYSAGYIAEDEMEQLRLDGVVGDICTILLRADGSWRDIELNRRATGPTPLALRRIKRRICVVAGLSKAIPTLAALRSGAVSELVIDEATALAIADRLRR